MIVLSIAVVNSGADLQPLAEDGAVLSNLAGPCTCAVVRRFCAAVADSWTAGLWPWSALDLQGHPAQDLASRAWRRSTPPRPCVQVGKAPTLLLRRSAGNHSRRARQARRVRGHQGRHQVHLRLRGRGPVLPHLASPPCPQGERQGGGPPPLTFDVASLRAKSHSASLPLSCASRPPCPPRRAGGAGRADARKNFRSPGPRHFRPIIDQCPQCPPRHRTPRSQSDRTRPPWTSPSRKLRKGSVGPPAAARPPEGAGAGSTGNQHLPKLLPTPPRPPPARFRGVDVALLLRRVCRRR